MPYSVNFGVIILKKGVLFEVESTVLVDVREYYDTYEEAYFKLIKYSRDDEFAHQMGDKNMSTNIFDEKRFYWSFDEKTWKRRFDGFMPREKTKAAWVQFVDDRRYGVHYSLLGRLRVWINS